MHEARVCQDLIGRDLGPALIEVFAAVLFLIGNGQQKENHRLAKTGKGPIDEGLDLVFQRLKGLWHVQANGQQKSGTEGSQLFIYCRNGQCSLWKTRMMPPIYANMACGQTPL